MTKRQIYRLFVFDFMGIASLMLPSLLAKNAGWYGILSIFLGYALASALLWMVERAMPRRVTKIEQIFLLIHSILIGSFVVYEFCILVQRCLVQEVSFAVVLFVLLATAFYTVKGGLKQRARVFEILYMPVMFLLGFLLFFSLKKVDLTRLVPSKQIQAMGVVESGYYVFFVFSIVYYLFLFSEKEQIKKAEVVKQVQGAMTVVSIFLGVLYFILIGTFGEGALARMQFPSVTLMSTIQWEGSFVKRLDAIMFGIWFFTLFALLDFYLFYGGKILHSLMPKKNKSGCIAVVLAFIAVLSMGMWYSNQMNTIIRYMKLIGAPVLIGFGILFFLLSLKGSKNTELEDRCFPMLVYLEIDSHSNEEKLSYVFKEKPKDPAAYGESKTIDYNHLKVLLLDKSIVQEKLEYEAFIRVMLEKEVFPRNTYVCICEDKDAILSMEEQIEEDLGSYLEDYLKKNQTHVVTLGDLIDDYCNEVEYNQIPQLEVKDNTFHLKNNSNP